MNRVKKVVAVIFCLIAVFSMMTACLKGNSPSPVTITETEVVMTVKTAVMSDIAGKKLVDYMDALVAQKEMTYIAEKGMVKQINTLKADASAKQYWMLYTDDDEYGNDAWGVYTYSGKTFKSATLGIVDLPIKEGSTYIFVVTKF
ncbi:MAG: hypothetical protein RR357_04265 [Clostridia bacterium]